MPSKEYPLTGIAARVALAENPDGELERFSGDLYRWRSGFYIEHKTLGDETWTESAFSDSGDFRLVKPEPKRIEITDIRQLATVNRVETVSGILYDKRGLWDADTVNRVLYCLANGIKVEGWNE